MWDGKKSEGSRAVHSFPSPQQKGWQRPNVIMSGLEIRVGDREKWAEKIRWVLRAMEVGEGS